MMEWNLIILGLRKNLNLTQLELSKFIKVNRRTIGRYEEGVRIPNKKITNKIKQIIRKNSFSIKNIQKEGKKHINKIRQISKPFILKHTKELAELIGILLGDGCIRKEGEIGISYDPKKDLNFLNRKTLPLINKVVGNTNIYIKGKTAKCFYNKSFVKSLEIYCNIKPGKKTENNNKIPEWCLKNKEYTKGVIRGIFDTDGTFDRTARLGRFSGKCSKFIQSIQKGLRILNIHFKLEHAKNKTYVIHINSKEEILKFFDIVGSSNLKHIIRFLIWRINKRTAKIDKEGFKNLLKEGNNIVKFNIEKIKLPFIWNSNNKPFLNYIKEDKEYIKNIKIKKQIKWRSLCKDLFRLKENLEIAKSLNITQKSVKRWKAGSRTPSIKFISPLLQFAKENKLKISNYEV